VASYFEEGITIMNNFLENLAAYVEANTAVLPQPVKLNYLTDKSGISLYLEPGGQVVTEFMDGMRDISLTFTFAVQDDNIERAGQTIWQINNALSDFDIDIPSTDDSYQFNKITLEKPYLSDQDEHGFVVYMLSGTAYLTTEAKQNKQQIPDEPSSVIGEAIVGVAKIK
jgi:hypothetical protein